MFSGRLGDHFTFDISSRYLWLIHFNPVKKKNDGEGFVKGLDISLEPKHEVQIHFSLDLKSNFVKFGGREIIEMEILLGSRKRLIDQPECLPR